jgi:hypothetical protein
MKTNKWQKLLGALHKKYIDQEVADRLGVQRTMVVRLRTGITHKCDWELGESIIALHKETYP